MSANTNGTVEQWDIFELELHGSGEGNPFLDVELTATHKDFFKLLESWVPDIIALDLVLPEMDGVEVIAELGRRRMTHVLVAGCSALLGSFFDADLIDELHVFVAPKLVGLLVAVIW